MYIRNVIPFFFVCTHIFLFFITVSLLLIASEEKMNRSTLYFYYWMETAERNNGYWSRVRPTEIGSKLAVVKK